jgi:hypothetical protein
MTAKAKNTSAARVRVRRRELRKEIERVLKLAEQALAELDDSVASRLRQLKAEMAATHPDRGGTGETFIKARQHYLAAKRIATPTGHRSHWSRD